MVINESHVTQKDTVFITKKRINGTAATLVYRIAVLVFGIFILIYGLCNMIANEGNAIACILGVFCIAMAATYSRTQAQQLWKKTDPNAVRRYSFRADELTAMIKNADGTVGNETRFTYDQIKKIYEKEGKLYIQLSLENRQMLFLIVDDDGYVLGNKEELKQLIKNARSDLNI